MLFIFNYTMGFTNRPYRSSAHARLPAPTITRARAVARRRHESSSAAPPHVADARRLLFPPPAPKFPRALRNAALGTLHLFGLRSLYPTHTLSLSLSLSNFCLTSFSRSTSSPGAGSVRKLFSSRHRSLAQPHLRELCRSESSSPPDTVFSLNLIFGSSVGRKALWARTSGPL